MPVNIVQGDTAEFVVEFLDVNGNITTPAGGTLLITYTLGTTIASTLLTLVQNGSFFTVNWDSTVADYGPGSWTAQALGSTTIASTGALRIIDP